MKTAAPVAYFTICDYLCYEPSFLSCGLNPLDGLHLISKPHHDRFVLGEGTRALVSRLSSTRLVLYSKREPWPVPLSRKVIAPDAVASSCFSVRVCSLNLYLSRDCPQGSGAREPGSGYVTIPSIEGNGLAGTFLLLEAFAPMPCQHLFFCRGFLP